MTWRVGGHLRGRVTGPRRGPHTGRPIWTVEVVNEKTGRVLNWDDAYTLAGAIEDAAERTSAARAAWFYGFTKRGLR